MATKDIAWIGSPNYSKERTAPIDRIVVHWMVGTLASTDAVFQDKNRGTSAHYGIEDFNTHQYVQEIDTAWHAGVGSMNARSIGIEHSAAPGRDASSQTIETSAQLIADLSERYNIPLDRKHVIKHSEVPYATQCSGTIPIDYLVERAIQLRGENMTKDEAYKIVSWDYRMGTGTDPTGDQAEYWANRIVSNPSAIDELGGAMLEQVNLRLAQATVKKLVPASQVDGKTTLWKEA